MSKRVLVVEDQEDNMQIMNDMLASAGYQVIQAVTGHEGVAMAESHKPDLHSIAALAKSISSRPKRPQRSRDRAIEIFRSQDREWPHRIYIR